MEQNIAPIEVPFDLLSPETLSQVVESFILREGTDYGVQEQSLEAKFHQVLKQIRSGKVKIIFDLETESVTLVNDLEWKKLIKASVRS